MAQATILNERPIAEQPPAAIDQERVEAFAEKMLAALNESAVTLMTSIGHRTGLFDTLAGLPPSTSEQIAEAAGLNERYVREWLATMVRVSSQPLHRGRLFGRGHRGGTTGGRAGQAGKRRVWSAC